MADQLRETGLNYSERPRWTESVFTIRTDCPDLCQMLREWFTGGGGLPTA